MFSHVARLCCPTRWKRRVSLEYYQTKHERWLLHPKGLDILGMGYASRTRDLVEHCAARGVPHNSMNLIRSKISRFTDSARLIYLNRHPRMLFKLTMRDRP